MAPQNDEYQLTLTDVCGSGESPSLERYHKQAKNSFINAAPVLSTSSLKDSSSGKGLGCCSKLSQKVIMKGINCTLLILLCIAGLVGTMYLLFDPIIQHIVLNRLVLRSHSEFAQFWENPPITPHLKVYFFNLTNAQNFFDGLEAPKVEQVGPYVYHQKWIKEDVSWHNNGTMSYRTKKEFKFIRELSVGNHSSDQIITLNVPVISALYQMRESSAFEAYGMTFVVKTLLNYDMWIQRTPEQLIWGYDEPLFELAKLILPEPPKLDKFGFFTKSNLTANLPKYTMYTGEGNPYNLSKISMFNGQTSLKLWGKNPETEVNKCNMVMGSDGATFNPYIEQDDTLWFFNDQLCQSMPLVFDKEVNAAGLPGYRFVPRNDVFKTPASAVENSCFCENEPLCDHIGDGMFAVSKCQMNAPIVLSWPHFLNANSSFINAVEGLRPDKDAHEFYFDVQPTTGTTLAARARIQINIAVLNIPAFNGLSKVNTTIVPILWFDEGLDDLGDDLRDVIATAVLDPPVYKNYILFGLAFIIGIIVVVGFISACMTCRNKSAARRLSRLENEDCSNKNILISTFEEDKFLTVRQIFNEKIPSAQASIQRTIGGEEVHMKLLDSGSSTEASSTDNSRISSASHSRNSSTGSNFSNPPSHSKSAQPSVLEVNAVVVPGGDNETLGTIPEVSSRQALLEAEEV